MGPPRLTRAEIPMTGDPAAQVISEELTVLDRTFQITCASMGNPHCVIFVDDVENFPVATYGPLIENNALFPRRTNVEFIQIISRTEIRQRTWERGAGETLACGTGSSAVTAACVLNGLTEKTDPQPSLRWRSGNGMGRRRLYLYDRPGGRGIQRGNQAVREAILNYGF